MCKQGHVGVGEYRRMGLSVDWQRQQKQPELSEESRPFAGGHLGERWQVWGGKGGSNYGEPQIAATSEL